jgi:signal transduction histidine kinase
MLVTNTLAPAGFDALATLQTPVVFVEARRPGLLDRILINSACYNAVFGKFSTGRWILVDVTDLANHGIDALSWFDLDWQDTSSPTVVDYNIGPEDAKQWWRFTFSALSPTYPLRVVITATPISDLRDEAEERMASDADILDEIEEMGGFGHYVFWPEQRRGAWHSGIAQIWSVPEAKTQTEFANMVAMIHPLDLRFRADDGKTSEIQNESQEVRIVGSDGGVRYVRSLGRRHIDDNGQVDRIIRVDMDVTELRRTEEELRLAREAASDASRAKEAFLNLMNHSLRTPLNAILGFGEAMRDQIYGPLSSDYIHCIDTVNDSANRLLELISDILDLTKLEGGRYSKSYTECNLDLVISEVIAASASRMSERNLRLATEWPDGNVSVRGDERGIRQILVNLLEFGTRSSRDAHTITIAPAFGDDGFAILRLQDDGFGLERAIKTAIDDPLGKGLATIQARGASSWFGLSLVKSFLDLNNSTLRCYDTPEGFFRIDVQIPV